MPDDDEGDLCRMLRGFVQIDDTFGGNLLRKIELGCRVRNLDELKETMTFLKEMSQSLR